jgi:hypothetical protein
VFSFLGKIARAPEAKAGAPAQLQYVLGLKFATRSRVEQNELSCIEDAIRDAAIPDIVLDKVENGMNEVAFWLHTANAKRAFKQLSELAPVADRMSTLQAAFADRTTLKFSILWPKGGKAAIPHGLG